MHDCPAQTSWRASVSSVSFALTRRRANRHGAIGSTMGAYPRDTGLRIALRSLVTAFPHIVCSIFRLSLTHTHTVRSRTYARTHARTCHSCSLNDKTKLTFNNCAGCTFEPTDKSEKHDSETSFSHKGQKKTFVCMQHLWTIVSCAKYLSLRRIWRCGRVFKGSPVVSFPVSLKMLLSFCTYQKWTLILPWASN